jgi:hypothetical protein
LETDHQKEAKSLEQSKSTFYVYYGKHFTVLPDQKTLIGVDKLDKKTLIMEDLTSDQPPVIIGKHSSFVYTLIFIEETNMLLVGDHGSNVIQYKLDPECNTWSIVKNYGNLGIFQVVSNTKIGQFVIFGGYGKSSLRVIDSNEMEMVGYPYETAIQNVLSLSICEVSPSQVYLSVSGSSSDYSKNCSNILDITKFLKEKNLLEQVVSKKSSDQDVIEKILEENQ